VESLRLFRTGENGLESAGRITESSVVSKNHRGVVINWREVAKSTPNRGVMAQCNSGLGEQDGMVPFYEEAAAVLPLQQMRTTLVAPGRLLSERAVIRG